MESAESEFILRIRRIFLSPCNCNDDLYLDKRIDFLLRISRRPKTRNSSPLYFLYIYYSELCVCIIFTENPLKGGYMDARSLHFTPLSKNGLDESSAKVWRASGWWKHFRLKHRVSEFTRRDHRRYFSQHRDPGRWLISYIFDSNASWISSPYFTFHALWMARSGYTNFHRSCNLFYELLR